MGIRFSIRELVVVDILGIPAYNVISRDKGEPQCHIQLIIRTIG